MGRASKCKPCKTALVKKWVEANPEKKKRSSLDAKLRRYGLTVEELSDLLEYCNFSCESCGDKFKEGERREGYVGYVIDHCHTTGRFRGLLCNACNCAIGYLKDDEQRIKSIASYLDSNGTNGLRKSEDLTERFSEPTDTRKTFSDNAERDSESDREERAGAPSVPDSRGLRKYGPRSR